MPVETTPKFSSPSGGTIKPDPVQALLMINTGLVQIVVTFFKERYCIIKQFNN